MKKKKIISLILATAMVSSMALAGCGKSEDKKDEGKKSSDNVL